MQERSINFKKDVLSNLQILAKRYAVSDSKVRSLRLVVYPSGIKTFILYRRVEGSPERIKIGRFPDLTVEQARNEAQRLTSLITLGQNPHKDRIAERRAITFRELYEKYYTLHATKFTKRPEANRKMMDCHVFPAFGKCKAKEITTAQIRNFHAKIGEKRAGSTANRLVTIISAAYNFGIRDSYIDCANPCVGLRKYKTVSRDRFLNFEELELFYAALEHEEPLFKDFFRLLLYTGARKTNVLSMKWSDINFDFKRWRLAETQTKNKDVNIVLLSEPALQILKVRDTTNRALQTPALFVFPGTAADGYLKDPKKAFDRVRNRMNIHDIRMHDLRRTLGSYMAISGISLPIIGKALNHKSQVSTAIYARLSNDPVLEAVNMAHGLMERGMQHKPPVD